jgi:benzoyl-CoA reductase/2-hydroxyglutaryl-CoA dehydratase subunit BcrC/BadD/HgdB
MDRLNERLNTLKENGRKLLGCFPLYPPVELFHAMGLEPLVMWGLKPFFPQTTKSDQHLQSFVCSVGRHLAEFVLSEAGDKLDGLFMYNACDTLRNLPEILRSGLEDEGRQLPILNIHIPMVPSKQTDARQYLKNEINVLIKKLEDTFGGTLSQNKFEESVDLYRKARKLARQLDELVTDGKVSFREFANLIQGNYLRSVEKQIESMETVLSKIETVPQFVVDDEPVGRVILSGILPPHGPICSTIEEAGLKIVGNDIASMARSYYYTPEPSLSPADYYVDLYSNRHSCTTLLGSADERIGQIEDLIEKRNATGIIFLGEKFCEYEYFEFPYLEKRFKERGLHTLLLEFAIDDHQKVGIFKTRIEAFSELMA